MSTYTASSGDWSAGANWSSNPNYPNDGNGGLSYDAIVSSGPGLVSPELVVTLTEPIAIESLSVQGESTVVTGNYNLTVNQSFTWKGGTLWGFGSLDVNGSANIDGTGVFPNSDRVTQYNWTVNNYGTTTVGATAPVGHTLTGGTFNNYGTYTLSDGSSVSAGSSPDQAGSFNNFGVVQTAANSSWCGIGGFFVNSGTLKLQGQSVTGLGSITQTAGRTILEGGSVSVGGVLSFHGGTLEGFGQIQENVYSDGADISPGGTGAAARLSIGNSQASLVMEKQARLLIELGGATPGQQFDQISALGQSHLGGTLGVSFINGFQLTATSGMTFTIVASPGFNIAGAFDNAPNGSRLLTSDGYGSFVVNYGTGAYAQEVTLTDFAPVPEPVGYGTAAGVGLVVFAVLRRRSALGGQRSA